MQHLLNQIQQEIDFHAAMLSQLQSAKVAVQSGDDTQADIFATGLWSRTLADEPVYEPVDEYEQAALRDAYYTTLEMMQYE